MKRRTESLDRIGKDTRRPAERVIERMVGALDSGDVQLNGGSRANLAGASRGDGKTEVIANVRGGEYSPYGEVIGVDQRMQFRDAPSSFTLSSTSRPHQVVRAALTAPISITLFASDQSPHKRFEISHAGSGADLLVLAHPGSSTVLAYIPPGQSLKLAPDGKDGWLK